MDIKKWIKTNHDIFHSISHIVLLIFQLGAVIWIGITANTIQTQNYKIQRTLYDFEPQISGFVNGVIWVYENQHQTVANIELLINAPHSGNFTLQISRFYPSEQYLDLEEMNRFYLQDNIRDVTYPQAYKYKADVTLHAYIYPKQNLTEISAFNAGALEFEIVYYDVSKNKMYSKLFKGAVWFEFTA